LRRRLSGKSPNYCNTFETAFHMRLSEVLFQDRQKPTLIPACDHCACSKEAHVRLASQIVSDKGHRFSRIASRVHEINRLFFENDAEAICQTAIERLAFPVAPIVDSAARRIRAAQPVSHYAAPGEMKNRVTVPAIANTGPFCTVRS
jgi:hypothetical protein